MLSGQGGEGGVTHTVYTEGDDSRTPNSTVRIRSIIFGSGSGSVDPVFKIRIQIWVTPKRPDPTGSGSYLDMFLMFAK